MIKIVNFIENLYSNDELNNIIKEKKKKEKPSIY
jgi:hypothetical protein